jgi:hypothetical protein
LTNRQGQTALFYAVETGRTAVVRYLLDHGAKVNVVDDMGRAPIDVAKGGGGGEKEAGSEEIMTLLKSVSAARN